MVNAPMAADFFVVVGGMAATLPGAEVEVNWNVWQRDCVGGIQQNDKARLLSDFDWPRESCSQSVKQLIQKHAHRKTSAPKRVSPFRIPSSMSVNGEPEHTFNTSALVLTLL